MINPPFTVGPGLIETPRAGSMHTVKTLIMGEIPGLFSDNSLPVVDVRDCAVAHVVAAL